MRKIFSLATIFAFSIPALAFAAFNDVTLTTDAVISVNGITLNVSGSNAAIESIEVGSTNFVVTLQPGSSFKVSAPSLNKLIHDVTYGAQLGQIDSICTGSASTLELSSGVDMVVTITPQDTLCTDAVSSGGGSSGGFKNNTPPVAQLVTNVNFSSLTPAEKQAVIAQIRAALIPLIQQLIVLLQQQIETMQAGGNY